MLRDIDIYCQGFIWNETVVGNDFHKISFLNTTPAEQPTPLTEKIKLNMFLVRDSLQDLTVGIEDTDTDGGNSAYAVPSDLSLDVHSRQPDLDYLKEFFRVVKDTTYIKYKIEIKDDGDLKYLGTIDQAFIKQALTQADRHRDVQIKIKGYETEFKEYFEGKTLPAFTSVMATGHTQYQVEYHNEGFKYIQKATLTSFLPALFEYCATIKFEEDLRDRVWEIVERAHFVKYSTGRLIWYKCGYASIVRDGGSIFDFFVKLMNSMGWQWFAGMDNGVFTIYIKNRSTVSLPTYNLNAQRFLRGSRVLGKSDPNILFKHIIIKDGEMFGGTTNPNLMFGSPDLRGRRWIIVTLLGKQSLYPNHLDDVGWLPVGGYSTIAFTTFSQRRGDFSYGICATIVGTTATFTGHSVGENDTLFINAGENTKGMQVDYANKKNYDSDEREPFSGTAMLFTGCYGNCLGYQAKNQNHLHVYNYWDYVCGNTDPWGASHNYDKMFENNMKAYIERRGNRTPELTVNELVWSPLITPEFNSDEHYGTEKFNIAEMKLNLNKRTTNFKLKE